MKTVHVLAALVALAPAAAFAEMPDADYCSALGQKYQTYVANSSNDRTPRPATAEAQHAIDQCKTNSAAAIPVLEQKLKDAKIDLPKRS